ncbi:MAG TPA: hypothetical protein ENH82_08125 [bacterium]|nr:hypothetical protein [bacterium]
MAKKGRKRNNVSEVPTPSLSKSVRMEKITNGFVVSTFTDKGEKAVFAKTKKAAKEVAVKLLG